MLIGLKYLSYWQIHLTGNVKGKYINPELVSHVWHVFYCKQVLHPVILQLTQTS